MFLASAIVNRLVYFKTFISGAAKNEGSPLLSTGRVGQPVYIPLQKA